jgi:hypothetical protein
MLKPNSTLPYVFMGRRLIKDGDNFTCYANFKSPKDNYMAYESHLTLMCKPDVR